MKKLTILLFTVLGWDSLYAQQTFQPIDIDSLKILLRSENRDTNRMWLLLAAGSRFGYGAKKNDSAFFYLQEALEIANKIADKSSATRAKGIMSRYYYTNGNFKDALELSFQNLKYAEAAKDSNLIFHTLKDLMKTYRLMQDYKQVLAYAKKYKEVMAGSSYAKGKDSGSYYFTYNNNKAIAYGGLGNLDSALFYGTTNYNLYKHGDWDDIVLSSSNLAQWYESMGKDDSAHYLYRNCLSLSSKSRRADVIAVVKLGMAKYFHKKGIRDSAFFYGRQALNEMQRVDEQDDVLKAYSFFAELNRDHHQYDSAYKYLQRYVELNDSLYNNSKIAQAQSFAYAETMEQQKMEQAKKEAEQQYRTRIKFYILAATIGVVLLIAFLLLRNLRNKRKANSLLAKQKDEIESTLSELKATQSQLIQSEKMASLGELTAGIAHEIQNPLNFVNNFSEVNRELVDELKKELGIGNKELAIEIAKDIALNEEKINHHGKRADAIVKGMLQHSRSSNGVKEPTDINGLVDEYLRLAYHGLRAKDNSFNARIITDFDESIGSISIIPQDIGRVVLNLINNAFYAASQNPTLGGRGARHEPTVSVRTKRVNGKVEISVKDNGNGIPEKLLDKIFQPFFTTKPTGLGTGLGLSLSYDIVKAHGGEIKVNTRENEGTVFTISVPA